MRAEYIAKYLWLTKFYNNSDYEILPIHKLSDTLRNYAMCVFLKDKEEFW